jgi:hypothetical protein
MIYPEAPGTTARPIEIFGVVGTPNIVRVEGGEEVQAQIHDPDKQDMPWTRSFFVATGRVAVLRWWKNEAERDGLENERYLILNAQQLDEPCYRSPNRRGGFVVLDPERAMHQANEELGIGNDVAAGEFEGIGLPLAQEIEQAAEECFLADTVGYAQSPY